MTAQRAAGEVDGVTIKREWIFQGQHLRAYVDNPACSRARVSFDHRKQGRSDFDAPQLISGVVRHRYASLVVQSARNDYYLNDDLADLRLCMRGYMGRFAEVSGMGFSMGGFAALLLSKSMNMKQVFLVSPMSPSFPKAPPFWGDAAGEAAIFEVGGTPDLAGISPDLGGTIVFDPHYETRRDVAYARFIQGLAPKIALMAMPWGGHPATEFLTEAKHYSPLLRSTYAAEIKPAPMKKVQRKFRLTSARYVRALQTYLSQRMARSDSGQRGG